MKQQAKALLERFGSLRGILDAPLTELQSVKGIGEISAIYLKVIRESATQYLLEASEGGRSAERPGAAQQLLAHADRPSQARGIRRGVP